MSSREWISGVTAAAVVVTGLIVRPAAGLFAKAPASVAVATVCWIAVSWLCARRRQPPRHIAWAAALAGACSLTATAGTLIRPYAAHASGAAGLWGSIEVAALAILHAGAVRWAPARAARIGSTLTGAGLTLWVLRFIPDLGVMSAVAATGFWALIALGVTAVAGYPRLVQIRRQQSVRDARRMQRLELAHDLHDFVAHDVTGIVVQAQAAAFVAETDPEQAVPALRRIEAAGLRALQAMDRTLEILRSDEGDDPGIVTGLREPVPGLSELPALVANYTAPVHLELHPPAGVPREIGSTVYRIVVEALTNIRRHAPNAHRIAVIVSAEGTSLGVTVTNDIEGSAVDGGRRGGFGLLALRERVEAVGGRMVAGPDPHGWHVRASLPLEPSAR